MPQASAGAPPAQHFEWMLDNWAKYKTSIARFNDGLLRGRVDLDALAQAYEEIILVWINAMDAGERDAETRARSIADDIRTLMVRMMNAGRVSCGTCTAWWNRYKGTCADLGIEIDADALRDAP